MLAAADELRTGEWIDTEAEPHSYSVEAGDDAAVLVVVEQAGVDLAVRFSDGTVANTPLGRMGPELVHVARGETTEFVVEPYYAAGGNGRFRLTTLPLSDAPLEDLVRSLFDASKIFGSRAEDLRAGSCDLYARSAELPGLDIDWRALAQLLAASCYFTTGRRVSTATLDPIPDGYAFLSILPYHAKWLRAELLFAAGAYGDVVRELEAALQTATRELADHPDLAIGIRHDVAEIRALLGGSMSIQVALGGGENGASANEAEIARRRAVSRSHIDSAVSEARELGDAYVLGRAYDFSSAAHLVNGESADVIKDLLLAKEQITKTGNSAWLVPILGSIGDFHKRWGELRAAQEAYLEALRIVNGNTSNGRYADTYHNAGLFYYDMGDFSRARRYIETSVALSRQTGRERRAYTNSRQLALILEEQGDYEAAKALNAEMLDYFARTEREERALSWSPFRILTQSAQSRIEYELGNLSVAWTLSAEAVAQTEARTANVTPDFPVVYINHANILFERGDRNAAFEILDRTIDRYANQPIRIVDLLAAKMALLQRSSATEEAIAVANRVFDIIENQRTELDAVRLGPYWNGRTNRIYTAHVDYLLRAGGGLPHEARAFEVAERGRATSLRLRRIEMLLARNATNDDARNEWIDVVSEAQKSSARQDTEREQLELEQRLTEARERYFASHGVKADPAALEIKSIEEVRQRLPEDTVLMQFVMGPERVWRFDVSHDAWSVTSVGETRRVQESIDDALYELANRYVRDQDKTLELSALLLSGSAFDLSGKDLLISPSDGLSAFPFSALQSNGEPIADLATMSFVPSISEYLADGADPVTEPEPDRLEIAVLADPAFDGAAIPSFALANVESFRGWADSLERLPASAEEAHDLSRYYSADDRLILLGAAATQRNFFDSRVTGARVIHIATHGYFNESMPELIGFAMAKSGGDDDGFVSMAEISAQAFSAELVVISACNTGRGLEIAGEGNMSLARTFLAQGVNAVVSTLWPVSDAATAVFMKEFYRALNEDKLSLPESLRAAQDVLRSTPAFRDPFYWSGYTLTVATPPRASR